MLIANGNGSSAMTESPPFLKKFSFLNDTNSLLFLRIV